MMKSNLRHRQMGPNLASLYSPLPFETILSSIKCV